MVHEWAWILRPPELFRGSHRIDHERGRFMKTACWRSWHQNGIMKGCPMHCCKQLEMCASEEYRGQKKWLYLKFWLRMDWCMASLLWLSWKNWMEVVWMGHVKNDNEAGVGWPSD